MITLTGRGREQPGLVNDISWVKLGYTRNWRSASAPAARRYRGHRRAALPATAVAVIPMAMVGGASMLFAAGVGCPSSGSGATTQPAVTTAARDSIPADYLALFKKTGQQYGVPWVLLAGIGKVESDDGQSALPGVHSGQTEFFVPGRSTTGWHRRRFHQHLARCPTPRGIGGGQRRCHRRPTATAWPVSTTRGSHRGGQLPAPDARRTTERRHRRLQPPSV